MLTVLLLACGQGDGPVTDTTDTTDTGGATPRPVGWSDAPASVSYEGSFLYAVPQGFTPVGDDIEYTSTEPYAYAQFTEPVEWASEAGYLDGVETCWSGDVTGWWPEYVDLGPSLSLDVGDDRVEMTRDAQDLWIEYWWLPVPRAPGFADNAGRALVLDGVDLGLEVLPVPAFDDFAARWATYQQTGVLSLTWEPEGPADARIVFTRQTETRYDRCVLEDDGEALLVFDGPPPVDVPNEFVMLARGQYALLDFGGLESMVFSEAYLNHTDPWEE